MPDAAPLADEFTRVHGRPPEGVFAAPGRVNLIGEHLDYNGGRCLPLPLAYGCLAAAAARTDARVALRSRQDDHTWQGSLADARSAPGWAGYAGGVLWALGEAGVDLPGIDIVVDGDVPLGAGLSSSAALECAVGLAASCLAGLSDDAGLRTLLVRACMRAENEVVGAPTGGLDQSVALLSTPDHALLLDFAEGWHRSVPWLPERHGLTLQVVDTRVRHALADGSYGDRRSECEAAAGALGVSHLASVVETDAALARLTDDLLRGRARHVFTEQRRVDAFADALDRGDPGSLGDLLTASHRSLRDDFAVSCPELDAVVDASLDAGAVGARMTGGGFGGSALVLTPTARADEVRQSVTTAFANRGWAAPTFLSGAASGPASPVRWR